MTSRFLETIKEEDPRFGLKKVKKFKNSFSIQKKLSTSNTHILKFFVRRTCECGGRRSVTKSKAYYEERERSQILSY